MTRRSRNRGPRGRNRLSPILATIENTALATADTVANVTLYAPPLTGTSSVMERWAFRLNSAKLTIFAGGTTNRIYVVVRKVPQGYTAPSISITNAVTTFADVSNVLAYGVITVGGGTQDPMNRLTLTMLKPRSIVLPGDSIVLQAVSDTTSSSQTFSLLAEYNVNSA